MERSGAVCDANDPAFYDSSAVRSPELTPPFARRNMIRSALVLTAVAGIVGAASLMAFTTETPLWVLVAVAALFGIMSGLGMIGNQAALYRQAPAENVGVAAGLMRLHEFSCH